MYGTIMPAKVKAGSRDAFVTWMDGWEERRGRTNGFHATELAWETGDPDRVVAIVHFRDEESYAANAQAPEQDTEYRAMVALLDDEPEWIDVRYGPYFGKGLPD